MTICWYITFHSAITINTDDELMDMPAGKENTTLCTVPMGVMKSNDGYLMQLTSLQSELLAVVSGEYYLSIFSCCATKNCYVH